MVEVNPSSGRHLILPNLFSLRRKAKKTNKDYVLHLYMVVNLLCKPFYHNEITFPWLSKKNKTNENSPPWQRLYRRFTFEDLRAATHNFQFKIGQGGFSNVYKGFISDSYKDVAVKRFKSNSEQQFFLREMELLSNLPHPNIVSLTGYCFDGSESNKYIVYEYLPRGTLHDQLHSRSDSQPLLSWKKRLEICIGAARGLEFLHTGKCKPSIIHRSIKTSNILLEKNWVAKISDFELSKLAPTRLSEADSHVSTHMISTIEYMDPEYLQNGHVTVKSDVYSFGVVLFELLSARKPWDIDREERKWGNLIQWCRHCVEDGRLDEIVDPSLKDEIAPECRKAYADMAYKCTNQRGNERPTMDVVLKRLQLTLLLQECIEAGIPFSPSWLRSIVPPPKRTEPLFAKIHLNTTEPLLEIIEIQALE